MPKRSALLAILALGGLACASPEPAETLQQQRERVARAQEGVAEDPLVEAHVAAVEAARAREETPMFVDEVELRVGDAYIDEHRVRVTARVPMNRPSELRAQREVYAAETRIAISRLEEVSLERKAELCFPSVEALAAERRRAIYADYVDQRQELLAWNADWRSAGTIDELRGARFELESRIRLASWEPGPVATPERVLDALPEIGSGDGALVRDPELIRSTVRRHHPSVALRRATAARYRALAERARARSQPWIKFVDVGYEYRSDDSENGVGGQLSFEIPLGGDVGVTRYAALIRKESGESRGLVEEQMAQGLQALDVLHAFEAHSQRWRDLLRLADEAEEIAERWWRGRLAKPSDVASLQDEAFEARSTVLEARERAGSAYCTLLATTGVDLEAWPREKETAPEATQGDAPTD
jgi:hypothetical protein